MIIDYLKEKDYTIKHYSKNKTLFKEGNKCHSLGIVLNGEIKISTYSLNGKEIIYSIIKDNQMFGNNLLFSSEKLFKGDVIATKDSDIAFIEKDKLLDLLYKNKNFMLAFLEYNSNSMKELNTKIKILSLDSIYDRFMYYLHINNNQIKYSSITELSSILNVARESMSRLIHKLEKEKVISIKNNIISAIN